MEGAGLSFGLRRWYGGIRAVRCPECATFLAEGSWSCSRCGYSFNRGPAIVHLDYWGGPLQVLLWFLLAVLVGIRISLPEATHAGIVVLNGSLLSLIIALPGARILEAICRSFCRHLRFSNGTTAGFSGRWHQILGWWTLWVLAGRRLNLNAPWGAALEIALDFLGLWATLKIIRWFVGRLELSSGHRFSFQGSYRGLLGWEILLALSVFTIIRMGLGIGGDIPLDG